MTPNEKAQQLTDLRILELPTKLMKQKVQRRMLKNKIRFFQSLVDDLDDEIKETIKEMQEHKLIEL